tara:strand:- start:808 stop:1545 length:738 start_codon:yes stop_codon:yes gene_type:complete
MSIWGKIIGGTAGFALGGPLGAIFGIMAGSAFDRKAKYRIKSSQFSNQQKQQIFAFSVIILSAKLAKADGTVTKDEINAFKEKFKISKEDITKVGKIFNEAKKEVYGYKPIADQIGSLFQDNKILLEELLNNLFYIAASDGKISIKEIELLKSISKSFKFTENDFQRIFQINLSNKESDPYKVLGVNRKDSNDIIRKKWLDLSKHHHPDNLIAKGMPKEFIDRSNEELAAINLAYDKIKEIRGIN